MQPNSIQAVIDVQEEWEYKNYIDLSISVINRLYQDYEKGILDSEQVLFFLAYSHWLNYCDVSRKEAMISFIKRYEITRFYHLIN